MPKMKSEKRDKAKELWLKLNEKGVKRGILKDIAIKLDVSPEQIRKWKSEDNWEKNKVTLLEKNDILNSNITKRKGDKREIKMPLEMGRPKVIKTIIDTDYTPN